MKYGVRFDGVNSAGTRLYDAQNLVWERSSNTVAGRDDFASLAPFNVKECITQYNNMTGKRDVLAYKGDSNWSQLVSDKVGDRMIEVPCFWYSRPERYTFIVSDRPEAGFKPSPMHYRKGRLYSKIRISKYMVNGNYSSQTGESIRTNTTMNTFRNNLRAKGLYMVDYATYCSLVILMIIKYSNMDIQSTVGYGRCGYSSIIGTGGTDNVLGLDGSATTLVADENILTFGIEDFFGNTWRYIDGLYSYDGVLYFKDMVDMTSDPVSYDELISDYIKLGIALPITSDASIRHLAFLSEYDYMLYPTEVGTSNFINDVLSSGTGFRLVYVGGNAWNRATAGLFRFGAGVSVSSLEDTSVGTPAVELVPNESNIYIDNNDNAYGVDNNNFTNLLSNYSLATDVDKILLHTTVDGNPSMSELESLDMPINVEAGNEESVARYCHLYALPKGQVVIPSTLTTIPQNMKISLVHIFGSGNVKIAVTKDGLTYQIYNFANKVWETIDINDIAIKGMSFTDIGNISDTKWELYNPTELGFAFYLEMEDYEDKVEVEKIVINYYT